MNDLNIHQKEISKLGRHLELRPTEWSKSFLDTKTWEGEVKE